jgi:hypothetical protein
MWIIWVGAVILFVTVIGSGAGLATDAGAQAAVRAHMECVGDKAAKMDDGQMQPSRVAELIQPLCHSEHEAAMLASSPQKWKATPEAQARELELDHTQAAVLYYRNHR